MPAADSGRRPRKNPGAVPEMTAGILDFRTGSMLEQQLAIPESPQAGSPPGHPVATPARPQAATLPASSPVWGILQTPVTALRGVAGRRAALLQRLGIRTWHDLIRWYPRDFEDWTQTTAIAELQDGTEQTFIAALATQLHTRKKGALTIMQATLRGDTGAITAVWFNQSWLADRLVKGQVYLFRGPVRRYRGQLSVQNPAIADYSPDHPVVELRAIYPLTEGLSQGVMRQLIAGILPKVIGLMPETLPAWVRREHHLCAADFAISRIHQPKSLEEAQICRRRLAFEELFLIQAGLYLWRRQRKAHQSGWPLLPDAAIRQRLATVEAALPFVLTNAQQRALAEIRADLQSERPMNRLVQGDVGSGKTVIAALSMLQVSLCGYQAVLMAPTSILARQHFLTLQKLLAGSGEPIALLTGATPVAERRRLLAAVQANEIRILVGTHALIEDQVQLPRLALAITDEQHRFGVRQRQRLYRPAEPGDGPPGGLTADTAAGSPTARPDGSGNGASPAEAICAPAKASISVPTEKAGKPAAAVSSSSGSVSTVPGRQPHVLVMSATPIPRTLALIIYGDLDMTVIDQLPAGRQPIDTYTAGNANRPQIEGLIRRTVQAGNQVYVICPMIEEAAASDLESVISTYNRLAGQSFPDLRIGLLHGDLKPAAKDAVMAAFIQNEIQVLVSTTVIEVGVDNPNATLMIIENAERFGLAQLHQLRGRIGRGTQHSVCILLSDSEDELARKRLKTLCQARDGFVIAEKDLELRGPGDFFGTRQHGLPALRLANLYRDRDLLQEVARCLKKMIAEDPDLSWPDHQVIADALRLEYGELFPTIDL